MAIKSVLSGGFFAALAVTKTVFHYGFIPTVIYLGFKNGADPGMPEITLMSLLWQ